MTDQCIVDRLPDEVQREYDFDHVLPCGCSPDRSPARGRTDRTRTSRICRDASTAFVDRHPEMLSAWVTWPFDTETAREAESETAIDLEADHDAPADTPLLALVAPELLPT